MSKSPLPDSVSYYATQGIVSDPGELGTLFNGLPDDIPSLCKIVQGLILHMHWAERYGVILSRERRSEADLRKVSRQLKHVMELDNSPLSKERSLDKRVVGTCRDFSTLLTSMLRHKGIPARARCGFANYFTPNNYEDHWICQYWKADDAKWVMVDAQIDQFQRHELGITFDSFDLPKGQFLPAGQAWQMCRSGKADPEKFGIFDMHGMWFIQGNLVRDLLSLNKIELLPWDVWTLMPKYAPTDIPLLDKGLLDYLASITMGGDETFTEVRSIYQTEERLRPPAGWEP